MNRDEFPVESEVRVVRLTTLEMLLDAAVGFYALSVTFENPDLALDASVLSALREAIREAASLTGRASEPRIVAILAEYVLETSENAQKAPENAQKPKKSSKKG